MDGILITDEIKKEIETETEDESNGENNIEEKSNVTIVNDNEILNKSIDFNGKIIHYKKNDNELFQDFVKRMLNFMFNYSLLSEKEIALLQEPVPKPLDKKLEILQGGQTDNCGH
jgi:hypothetical protein